MAVDYQISDSTATITIRRPQCYNALDLAAMKQLANCLEAAGQEKGLRAIILTGEGDAFCSGQDLNEEVSDLRQILETGWIPLIKAIEGQPLPVIAAVDRVCAGAGISLALACDLVFSRPETRFVAGFTRLGLVPDAGTTFTLLHHLGKQRAMGFFLFNRPMVGGDLQKLGLVNETGDEPLELAQRAAADIGQMAPLALAALKRNLHGARDGSFAASLALEIQEQASLGKSADFREGVAAFREKRPARFQGH